MVLFMGNIGSHMDVTSGVAGHQAKLVRTPQRVPAVCWLRSTVGMHYAMMVLFFLGILWAMQ